MATRLYFDTQTPLNSPAFDSSWEVTGSAVRRILDVGKDDRHSLESLSASTASNTPAGSVDVLIAQYVSAPLSGSATISGAIQGQIRALESSTSADLRMQCVIRVLQSDYSTVRGTLIASNGSALSNEFIGSLRNVKIPLGGSTTPSSVTYQDGDVLVVEIGYRKHESATTNRTGTFSAGNPTGTDLPVDETTATADPGWIEFTEALTFKTVTTRASQVVVQPAVTPPDVTTRASQVVVQPAITPPAVDTRVSQVVVQPAITQSAVDVRVSQVVVQYAILLSDAVLGAYADLSVDYVTRKPATSDLAVDYVLRAAAHADLDIDYEILTSATQVGSELGIDAPVRALAHADLSSDAVIRAPVSKDLSPSYAIGAHVVKDLSPSYAIRVLVSKSLSPSYAIKAHVSKDLSFQYAVSPYAYSQVGASLGVDYAIAVSGGAGSNLTFTYSITKASRVFKRGQDLRIKWKILPPTKAGQNLSLNWVIRPQPPAGVNLTLDYVMTPPPPVGAELALDWAFATPVGADLTIDWPLEVLPDVVGSELSIDYDIENPRPVSDLGIDYEILPPTTGAVSLAGSRYVGRAMAIHVLSTTTSDTFSAAPEGPNVDAGAYVGQSSQVFAHPDSPPQWDDATITGPSVVTGSPVYRGVSHAIHVFGEGRSEWPPVEPVPSCECDCSCGITDSPARTVAETVKTGSGAWAAAAYLGLADVEVPWMVALHQNVGVSVSGGAIKIRSFDGTGGLGEAYLEMPWSRQIIHNTTGSVGAGIHSFKFSIDALPGDGSILWLNATMGGASGHVWVNSDADSWPVGLYLQSHLGFGTPGTLTSNTELIPNDYWTAGADYIVKMWDDGARNHIWIQKIGENRFYTASTVSPEVTTEYIGAPAIGVSREAQGSNRHQIITSIWDVDLPEYTRCTFSMLDTFVQFSDTTWAGLTPSVDSWYEGGPSRVQGWTNETVSDGALSVRYGRGMMDFTGDSGVTTTKISDDTAPWNSSSFTLSGLFKIYGSAYARLNVYKADLTVYRTVKLGDGVITIYNDGSVGSAEVPYAWEDSLFYFFRITVVRGSEIRVRVWPIDQAEPSSWNVTLVDDGAADDTPVLRAEGYGVTDSGIEFNWINIGYDNTPCVFAACDTLYSDWSTMGGWEWVTGNGDGAYGSGRWGVGGGAFYLDVAADSGTPDDVGIALYYSSDPALFEYLRGGAFTLTGSFTLPYDLPQQSQGEMASFSLSVDLDDGNLGAVTVNANLGGTLGGRVLLAALSFQNYDDVWPGALAAGTHDFSLTVRPDGATATIAGHELSVSTTINMSLIDRLSVHIGQAPPANQNLTHGGVFQVLGLNFQREDGAVSPWCSSLGGTVTSPNLDDFSPRNVSTVEVVNGADWSQVLDISAGGYKWETFADGLDIPLTVADGFLRVTIPPGGMPFLTLTMRADSASPGSVIPAGLVKAGDVTYRFRAQLVPDAPNDETTIRVSAGPWDPAFEQIDCTVVVSSVAGTGGIRFGYSDYYQITSWASNGWYNVKMNQSADSPYVHRAKVWHETDPEPDWQISYSPPAATLPANLADGCGLELQLITRKDIGYVESYVDFDTFVIPEGLIPGSSAGGCTECEDPANPGLYLPAFTPGYLPIFRRQIGDPTTRLDSYLCAMESGAMVLDWHTRGAVQVWGGELVLWSGQTEASIIAKGGTNLSDVRRAWQHWGQYLDNRSGQTWASLVACLNEGRAIILLGDYGVLSLAERCQDSFDGNHAVSVYPYAVADRLLVGDPLCSTFKGLKSSSLQAYAEAFGAAVYGTQSPQPILFAVSKPWTP